MKNDMTDVKISVIVPCHNVVGMVGECLESIVNQTIGLSHLLSPTYTLFCRQI